MPVAGPVGAALGLPTTLINDARAFGLAELRLGAARGADSMIGLTLGTGIGGVIAIDGRVHLGHDGTGGELGHQTLEPDGPPCGCGNRGCLEAFARADRIAAACGTATAEEAMAAARAGDPAAVAGLVIVGRYLGIGIANMIVVVNPDVVVIGGGIAAAFDLLHGPIEAELRERVYTTALDRVRVVPAELGTWAGAIGAALHGAETADRDAPAAATIGSRHDDPGEHRAPAPLPPDRAGPARADRDPGAGRPIAIRRGAVRGVRCQPDDGAQCHAAPRRGRPDHARSPAEAASWQIRPCTGGPIGS